MTEIAVAERWIYGRLYADATLIAKGVTGVYADRAPDSAKPPYIVFALLTPRDVWTVETVRIMSTLPYVVRAIGAGRGAVTLDDIADRVDALLHAQGGSPTGGGLVLACVRERPFTLTERTNDGVYLRHLGGIYRLEVQDA